MSMHLLNVQERLRENLTGQQIANILDKFLYAALEPIYRYSEYVNTSVSDLLLAYVRDRRRKPLLLKQRDVAISHLYRLLAVRRSATGWSSFRRVRFQRHVLGSMIEGFLEATAVPSETVARELNISPARLGPLRRWVDQCWGYYTEFKGMVIEKYIRYAYTESKRSLSGTTLQVDPQDLNSNLMLSIDRAIGMFDARRESSNLTKCVKSWFGNAKTNPEFRHVYGQSYDVSSSHRKTMSARLESGASGEQSWSVSLDKIEDSVPDTGNVEQRMVREGEVEWWNDLLNASPDLRLARLYLETPYRPADSGKIHGHHQHKEIMA